MTRPAKPVKIELLEPEIVAALQQMTPTERMAIAFECNRTMRLRLAGHFQTLHPEWSADEIDAEVARRMSLGSD